MGGQSEIRIIVSADGTAAIAGIEPVKGAVQGVETAGKTAGLTMTSVADTIKTNWLAATAAIYGAMAAGRTAFDWVEKAAKAEQAMASLDALTHQYGTTALELTGRIETASKGLIDMHDSARVAGDALMKGVLNPDQIAQMAAWSVSISHVKGGAVSAAEAFEMLSSSISTGRERGLKQLVGITDLVEVYGKYADSMNKAEKAQAMYSIASARMTDVQATLGKEIDSTYDKITRFKNQLEDFTITIGGLLIRVGAFLFGTFQSVSALILAFTRGVVAPLVVLTEITDYLGITTDKARTLKEVMEGLGDAAQHNAEQARDNFDLMYKSSSDLVKGFGKALPPSTGDENRKVMEELEQLNRAYLAQRDVANSAAYDADLVKLNHWFDEQVKKLRDLHASQVYYNNMYAAYSAEWDALKIAAALKISEAELKAYEETEKRKLELRQAIGKVELDLQEQNMKSAQALDTLAVQAGYLTEMEGIQKKAESERALLEIQRQRNWLAHDALTVEGIFIGTEAQLMEILGKEAALSGQIRTNREYESRELAARRLKLEIEIRDIEKEQLDLINAANLARAQAALQNLGASDLSTQVGIFGNIQAGTDPDKIAFDKWSLLQDQRIMRLIEQGKTEAELQDYYREYDLRQEEMVQQQKLAMASSTFSMMAGLMTSLYNMQGQQGGAAFEMMKAFRIGETLINTYSSAVGAYNALSSIPYVGPALGAAAAVAAIAFGMAQVSAIESMRPGGGGRSASVGALGGGSASFASPSGPSAGSPAKEKSGMVVNITVYGSIVDHDAFARQVVPAIARAQADGVTG